MVDCCTYLKLVAPGIEARKSTIKNWIAVSNYEVETRYSTFVELRKLKFSCCEYLSDLKGQKEKSPRQRANECYIVKPFGVVRCAFFAERLRDLETGAGLGGVGGFTGGATGAATARAG